MPLVIVNPASANGSTGDAWPSTASEMRRHFGPFECAHTTRKGEAAELAEREALSGRRFIIACGGDGTISEAANGILRSGADAELGLLPSGTGGDFRRTLKIPTRAADAAIVLRNGETRRIDAGRVEFVNDEGANDSRYFVNVASFGMGGEVIRRVKERSIFPRWSARLLGGKLTFAAAALHASATFVKPAALVSIEDSDEARLIVTNFCVANAQYFGGGMRIAPTARLSDGLFDVVSIGDMSALSILANSYRVYLGTHLGMREVRHARARRVSARAVAKAEDDDGEVKLEVDGELVGRLPAAYEITRGALRVRCPKT